MLNLIAQTGALPWDGTPFGSVMLVLLGILGTFTITLFVSIRAQNRAQLVLLTQLKAAVMPDGRAGLVERVEQLEINTAVLTRDFRARVSEPKEAG